MRYHFFQEYRARAAARRLRLVERVFRVKYSRTGFFPPGVFQNDYGERRDFLPKEDDVVIDVGANIGDWSIIVGSYYKARVIAVEPSKEPFGVLSKNIRLNKLQKRVTPVNCALSDRHAELTMNIERDSGFAHSKKGSLESTVKVPARTLDALVKKYNLAKIDLVKIDAEGFENRILKGASHTISRLRPRIIVEVHSEQLRKKVLKSMIRKGYLLVHEKMVLYEPHQSLLSILYLASA